MRARWFGRLASAMVLLAAALSSVHGAAPPRNSQVEVRVGIDAGDFRGNDQRALQAAVDCVARLGGGTVHVAPGRYLMRNALALRDNVRVSGVPGCSILAPCDGASTRLAADGDCNERQVTLGDPSAFRVGDGIVVYDDRYRGGFTVTTATLTARVNSNTFRVSAPLYLDYMVSLKASASLVFPVVGGWHVKNAAIEGITIDGSRNRCRQVDGCRAGGIYLFECYSIAIRNCEVHGFNGDGISFQVSQNVTVESCTCRDNVGLGLHPGSGSQHPVVRRNRSLDNGGDGLFVCWRVKHGVFEDNEVRGNKGVGLSIGHKDTDNVFRRNVFAGNSGAGIFFREETEPMGAHRNVFEDNRVLDNGTAAGGACVVIHGHHYDLVFRHNTIGHSRAGSAVAGIDAGAHARGLRSEDNRFIQVRAEATGGPGKIEATTPKH